MKDLKPKLIGKKLYPVDNSFQYNMLTGKAGLLAGSKWNEPKEVTIISEPYKAIAVSFWAAAEYEHEFVTVLFEGEPYICLNHFQTYGEYLESKEKRSKFEDCGIS